MENLDTTIAKSYHEETKHSEISIRTKAHYIDWSNKPGLYKLYPKLQSLKLPSDFPRPSRNAIDCVTGSELQSGVVDNRVLAALLYFSAGITKQIRYPSGEAYDFRAAACTGALYEIETYVVTGDVPGVKAGVYHFNPKDFALRQLRAGDHRGYLYEAAGERVEILSAPVSFVLTAIHWRNAWKYQSRSYRHFFWDSGTIIANILAVANATRSKATVVLGFVDDNVHRLLGLDAGHETSTALVAVGGDTVSAKRPVGQRTPISEITHEHLPASKGEVLYPEMLKVQSASALTSPAHAKSWTSIQAPQRVKPIDRGEFRFLKPLRAYAKSPLAKVILRRGSTRQFSGDTIPFTYLSTILYASTSGISADFLSPKGSTLVDAYLILNVVGGIEKGAYYHDQEDQALELLKLGNFRDTAGYLCLEQPFGADCSAAIFLMANLDRILGVYGNRGYRAAQLEAGIILGKMYLSAYALDIGASGITFYDDAVKAFFSPHAAGKGVMAALVLGVPAYGKKPGFLADNEAPHE